MGKIVPETGMSLSLSSLLFGQKPELFCGYCVKPLAIAGAFC
jgi:hypothetical protein